MALDDAHNPPEGYMLQTVTFDDMAWNMANKLGVDAKSYSTIDQFIAAAKLFLAEENVIVKSIVISDHGADILAHIPIEDDVAEELTHDIDT